MRIEKINIERFGRRANLALEGLSDQLNVVYGPNGSGKTTAIQFIRWILYGNCDSLSRQYVGDASGTAIGSATIVQDGLRRKIARQDDGTRQGRLTVDGKSYSDQRSGAPLVSLMGDISQHDFDITFAPSFDEEPNLSALLQSSRNRGMELTSRREPSDRVQQIRLRIDNHRRDLDRLPWVGQELAFLVDHRSSLQRRVGQIEDDSRRRRVSIDREYEEIAHQVEDLEAEIGRLRGDWHAKDNDVNARRSELEEAWRVAEEARQEFLRVRRTELVEIENQLDRARGMLSEFQRRFERLDQDLRDHELSTSEVAGQNHETLCLVQSIAQQLDDLRTAPGPGQIAPVYRAKHEYPSTVHTSAASLDALRGEVGRLCRVMQADRTEDKVQAMSSELKQLRQCETEIEQWTSRLVTQRDQLAKEIDEAERFGVSLVADNYGENYFRGEALDPNYFVDMPDHPRRVRAVLHSCDGYEPVEPEADELLRRLSAEREAISRDLDTSERRLRQLLDRRRELESILRRVNDHEIAGVRREIAELEAKIRSAEERDRILREIERLEGELARLRDDIVPSHITAHAIEILRELTRGRYVDVRFVDGTSVMVQEASGAIVPHSQLSRGARDQVYLSFCLALIAAYRRQGIELPLILNDAFINIDSDQDDALAAVLSGFARQEHQVILFTRHRHVADLFKPYTARFLEIGLTVATPTMAVDQVRFKPYGTADLGRTVQRPATETHVASSHEQSFAVRPVSRDRNITQRGVVSFRRGNGDRSNHSEYRDLVEPTLTTPQPIETRAGADRDDRWTVPGVLAGDTPLDSTGVVDVDTSCRLAGMGIVTVDEFLRSSPELVERELGLHGAASLRPIRHWRYELALRSLVPNLGVEDARVLVACGVTDVRALADATPHALSSRIQQTLTSVDYRRAGTRPYRVDSSALQDWIHAARGIDSRRSYASEYGEDHAAGESRAVRPTYEHDDAREYSRDFGRRKVGGSNTGSSASRSGFTPTTRTDYQRQNQRRANRPNYQRSNFQRHHDDHDREAAEQRFAAEQDLERTQPEATSAASQPLRHATQSAPIITGNTSQPIQSELAPPMPPTTGVNPKSRTSAPTSRTKTRPASSGSTSSRSASRAVSARSGGNSPTPRGTRSAKSRERALRFFLDPSDPVVDAPSIGAKTAQKLRTAGIVTVADLLSANAGQLAKQLDERRITAEVIGQWQSQTTLCCRVPELRAHDAQILVACDVTTPEQLAQSSVDDLWRVVGPFAKTNDGKRIIRGGKAPDKAEVTDWITWSQSART